jgi:translation initiation factor IF-2
MSEGKQIKLMEIVKEFNLGKDTIAEFLKSKDLELPTGPNPKLSDEMVSAIHKEYALEKKTKQSSETVSLSGIKRPAKADEATPIKEVPIVEKAAPVIEAPKPAPIPEPTPEPIEELNMVIEPIKAPLEKGPEVPTPEKIAPVKAAEEEVVENPTMKISAPTLSGPKVIDKIDLEAKAPKKGGKKTAEKSKTAGPPPLTINEEYALETEKAKQKAAKKKDAEGIISISAIEPTAPTSPVVAAPPVEDPAAPAVIENVVERRKLDGLNVLGKIELPSTAKRPRKRISVDKTGFVNTPNTDNRGGGGGGYNRGPGGGNRSSGPGGFNRGGPRTGTGAGKPEDRVITDAEVQAKIQETLARLSGGGNRGRNKKNTYRKDKRELMAEKRAARDSADGSSKLKLTEFISVSELASLMDVNFTEIIGKCMNLGLMVSINQRLDAEVIELVASEFGFEVEFINLEQEADKQVEEDVDSPEDLIPRAPIVTIMGHVDHGKTSLLDNIRNANVVAGESGGITQHIGAYEVTLDSGKQITFLDTPGHEAFTAMRARGAKVTDLAIIVIAADDAVMPQTTEAINHAQAAGTNMIFAINKMDKDGANPQKIYEQLSGMNILVEEWGGKFQSQPIAAKKGENVDLLLEKILLEADLMDLKANPNRKATGSIIEASLDKGRGYVATILVQNGTLKVGDMIVAGTTYGRVKAMANERGGKVIEAGPSTPVQILGLNGAPQAGEKFKVYEDEDEAKEVATHRSKIMREQGMRTRKHITMDEIGRRLALGNFKQLNVIIKGDVDGSVEALSDSLIKLGTEEIEVRVIHKAVGQIAESDVTLAAASDAIIIGFQVRPSAQANKLADEENIEIKFYSVIYDAINDVKNAMEGLLEPKIEQKRTCNIEVKEIFKITGVGTVAGCMVLDGKMSNKNKINIIRDGIVIYNGELGALKRFKDDAKEVFSGMECGLSVKNYDNIQVGDIIEGYEEVEVKRTL